MMQGSATYRETEARTQPEHGCQCGDCASLLGTHLLEVVEGGQDNVMATSDQADSGQQLQHQCLGPAETWGKGGQGHGASKGTRGQGDGSYLAFLLLRLRVISLTQAGWFITRLKPDFGGKGNINGVMRPPVPTPGMLRDLGTFLYHVPTRHEVERGHLGVRGWRTGPTPNPEPENGTAGAGDFGEPQVGP